MPQFRYLAWTADGKREAGTGEYPSEASAFGSLVSLGLTVIELEPVSGQMAGADQVSPRFSSRSIPLQTQADIAEQMAMMLAAGLRLPEIVKLVGKGSETQSVKSALSRASQLIEDGVSFPDAFKTAAKGFSPLFSAMVELSYGSSQPAIVLSSLSAYLRRQGALGAQIGSALIYPVILLISAAAIIVMLSLVVAPSLTPIFASADQPVPGALAVFSAIGVFLKDYWAFGLAAIAATLLFVRWAFQRFPSLTLALKTRTPVVSSLVVAVSVARLTRATELLLASGRPLALALRETADALDREIHSAIFRKAAAELEAGNTASSAFELDKSLPAVFVELFRYGEKTNTLPDVLRSLSSSLENKADAKIKALTTLLVPALTLIVGGGIASLVYAVMGAVFSVSELGGL